MQPADSGSAVIIFIPIIGMALERVEPWIIAIPAAVIALFAFGAPAANVFAPMIEHDALRTIIDFGFSGGVYGVCLSCGYMVRRGFFDRVPSAAFATAFAILLCACIYIQCMGWPRGVHFFGWSFFWFVDPSQLVPYWKALVGSFGLTGTSTMWELTAWEYWPVFIICALASTPIVPWLKERVIAHVESRKARSILGDGGLANPRTIVADTLCVLAAAPASVARGRMYEIAKIALDIILLVLFFASIAAIISGSFNPFIYFQF